ncbi:MAG: DUF3524 domain-containing protein [Planctomycetes bacterium]|nr:DUF3524 domain-containing protein [Planctomycetota bacterium]
MRILALEPWHGGSHGRFLNGLIANVDADFRVLSLPARAWKWRMRLAAPWFADQIRARGWKAGDFDLIFATSLFDLPTFVGMAPASFAALPRILYWHENQLAYPVREDHERDRHFGVTNLLSALAADLNLFNSNYNLESLVGGAAEFLSKAPDSTLSPVGPRIAAKSAVLPVPIDDDAFDALAKRPPGPPIVVWNHRWEHDKGPDAFFEAVLALADEELPFRITVLGQRFRNAPSIFSRAEAQLGDRIEHWGPLPDRSGYLRCLGRASVVVSTARHEFQGLAMLEATAAGARPLAPRRLAYPEFLPDDCLYDDAEFTARLRDALNRPWTRHDLALEALESLRWGQLGPRFRASLEGNLVKSESRDDR